ncbi:hypothetical protein [Vibrio parahaemolyticus]|uniref:hypothetical protein n=1 Tax=Vibrio parahaemolyticus TaxID=670 RepID=UPI00387A9007
MNDYGFISAENVKNLIQFTSDNNQSGFELSREDLNLKNMNPIIKNNENAFNLAIADPERFEMSYEISPITQRKKIEIDAKDIQDMSNASVGEILYKTKNLPKFIDPGSSGYDEWQFSNAVRQVAFQQIENAATTEQLQSMLSEPINSDKIGSMECSYTGGIVFNQNNEYTSGYEDCLNKPARKAESVLSM